MKILWITNILFPEAEILITNKGELRASGGWMLGAADALLNAGNFLSLSVASVSPLVEQLTVVKGKQITYYVLPYGKGNSYPNKEYEPIWVNVYNQCQADIVHIHGTEYSHGLAFLNACPNVKSVISIQGLTSVYSSYYDSGLRYSQIIRNFTLRDILRGTIFEGKRKFAKRGKSVEIPMLSKVNHIIGRTSWDRAHAWAINPGARYYFCNEILRADFYDGSKWDYNQCEKHTIFLSQAGYPLKGLHQVLRAMPLILRHYPDAKIKVAGADITKYATWRDKLRISGYGKIIRGMIRVMNLEDHVEFLGPLNAEQMKQAYLSSNVFVCPSSIENSPNSLGEAQLLGVPCVAAYVGGVSDMMKNYEKYMYRFEEIEMLAFNVIDIFNTSKNLGDVGMSTTASIRHDAILNTNQLLAIYNEIIAE